MAKFLVLSDFPAPGDGERNLKDSHGKYFWHLMIVAGVPLFDLAIDFIYHDEFEARRGVDRTLGVLAKHKPEVIVALGDNVLRKLNIKGNLKDVRGSVYDFRGVKVVPTYHPRELKSPLRMFSEEPVTKGYFTAGDLQRAVTVFKKGWSIPQERFCIEPTIEDVRTMRDLVRETNPLLGCDLECTGLSIEHRDIFVHGFAWSESDAICIPEKSIGNSNYWPRGQQDEVMTLIQDIYKEGSLMFQNGVNFDVPFLWARGWDIPLENFKLDTMVMHHALQPELPHNIGFINSVYGKQAYWKDSFLSKKVSISETDQLEMRRYNCRDCTALIQIHNGMLEEVAERMQDPVWSELENLIEKGMKLSRITIESYKKGIKQDKVKTSEWRKYVETERFRLREDFYSKYELPDVFSMNSTSHKARLVYGTLPGSLSEEKLDDALKTYDNEAHNYQYECRDCGRKMTKKFFTYEEVRPNIRGKCTQCKDVKILVRTEKERTNVKPKSKESKAYLDLMDKKAVKDITPLYQLHNYKPLKTKAKADALDKGAVTRYINAIDIRLSKIEEMVRTLPKHQIEAEGLAHTRQALVELTQLTKFEKLMSAFHTIPTWADGRVRPTAMVTGTATGRWSYKAPNIQQMPHGAIGELVRSTFRADKGCQLLSVDFSNLEVQIGARFMRDEVLIEMLEKGLNLHDENTFTFFGLRKGDEGFATHRPVSKMIQFARLFYGGGDRSIYSKAKTQEPECSMTFKHFIQGVQNYERDHPAYILFVEAVQELAREKRISVNAYGRVRTMLGEANAIGRQALNTPIQGSAADAVGEDMILLDEYFKAGNFKTYMPIQVHDEILFHVPNDELLIVGPKILEIMNRERQIHDYKFRIPVDAELGTHWGLQKPYDLATGTFIDKDSKH